MLIICCRLAEGEGSGINFKRISNDSNETEKEQFRNMLDLHLQFPLVLLRRCDDTTALLTCNLFKEVFDVKIMNEDIVEPIDKGTARLVPGAFVVCPPIFGLYDRSKFKEDETPYQYIIRLWKENRASLVYGVVPLNPR